MTKRAHAIVIGIDAYVDPSMTLKSAVSDACRFATWAIRHGNVDPADLTMLLAPSAEQGTPPMPREIQVRSATRDDINAILEEYTTAHRGQGAQRLYVYFAGHGLAGAAATHVAASEPVLLPSDYRSPSRSQHLLLRFSDLFSVLRQHAPREQIFLFDGCRDYAPDNLLPAPGQTAIYVPPPSLQGLADQCALYGTSLGRKANEHEGQGVFTGALLEALAGREVELAYSYEHRHYEIRFDALATAVIGVVRRRSGGGQVPEPRSFGATGMVVVTLDVKAVPMVDVDLMVQPSALGRSCEVEVLEFSRARRDLVVTYRLTADAGGRGTLTVQPGRYPLRMKGEHCSGVQTLEVLGGNDRLKVTLRVEPDPTHRTAAHPKSVDGLRGRHGSLNGLESFVEDDMPDVPAEAAATTGVAVIRCADDGVDLALLQGGKEIARGRGELRAERLDAGVYTAVAELSGQIVRTDLVVLSGSITDHEVELPAVHHTPGEQALLDCLGVTVADDLVHIEGVKGALASPRLSEILALVANRRAMASGAGGTRILVKVASPDDHDAIAEVGVALEGPGRSWRKVLSLSGPPASGCAIFEGEVVAGPLEVRLDLPGIAQTNLCAVAFAERTVAVIVVLRRSSAGRIAVVHLAHIGVGISADVVRAFDRAQHMLRSDATLAPALVRRAVAEVTNVPLFGLLAALAAEPDTMASDRAALGASLSAMPQLRETADVARLYGRDPRSRFAVTARAAQGHPRVLGRELLPSATWATWVQPRPVLVVGPGEDGVRSFGPVPASWQVLDEHRAAIDAATPAVGVALRSGTPCATAFLVAHDEVITPSFVADDLFRAGVLSFRFGARIHAATAIIHSDPRSFVARVRVDTSVPATPLTLATSPPSLNNPRAAYLLTIVVELPVDANTVPPLGVAPGLIVERRPAAGMLIAGVPSARAPVHDIFIHDCASAPGSAGAPLIDLETGEVVGLHHSAEFGMARIGVATVFGTL